jgi:hypothetical protein
LWEKNKGSLETGVAFIVKPLASWSRQRKKKEGKKETKQQSGRSNADAMKDEKNLGP